MKVVAFELGFAGREQDFNRPKPIFFALHKTRTVRANGGSQCNQKGIVLPCVIEIKAEKEGQDRNMQVFQCKYNRFFSNRQNHSKYPYYLMKMTLNFSSWRLLFQDQYFRGPGGFNDEGATWWQGWLWGCVAGGLENAFNRSQCIL